MITWKKYTMGDLRKACGMPENDAKTVADCHENIKEENNMKKYIGTKIIHAQPMTRGAYNEYRGWPIPAEQNSKDDGYLVRYPDGYESWSPKAVFEDAYWQTDAMNFGLALEAAKNGERVARKGWNGKDMYIFLAYEPDFITDADISAFDNLDVEVGDMLVMKTAQNTFQPGWLASQADMLAEDWFIVE